MARSMPTTSSPATTALPHPAGGHPRHPRGLPRSRRRHRHHQHLQREPGVSGGLRPHGRCECPQSGQRPDRPRGCRCHSHRRAAPLRRGRAGAYQQDSLGLAGHERPRQAHHRLRHPRRCLPRGGGGPHRGRGRSHPAGDDLRFAERQGGPCRAGRDVRGHQHPGLPILISGTVTDRAAACSTARRWRRSG